MVKGESKEILFTIDFDDMVDKTDLPVKELKNTDYGDYILKLTYKDCFCKHEIAAAGPIVCNEIKVHYVKR